MMKLQPIQYGFSSGEITPRLFGNTQSDVYRNGVAELLNMTPLAHGPAVSRGGSYYISTLKDKDNIRLIPFNIFRGQSYLIELGPFYIRIHNENEHIDIGGQELLIDPIFRNEFIFWTDTSSGSGNVTFSHEFRAANLINATGSNVGSMQQQTKDVVAANIGLPHTIAGDFSGDGELQIEVGTAVGLNDILNTTITTLGSFSVALTPTTAINWIKFTNAGAGNTTATIIFPHFRADGVTTELVTPYEAADLPDIQYELITSQDTLILVHGKHPPIQLVLFPVVDFQLSNILFVFPPVSWAGSNYPAVIAIFQSRLWLARTPSDLQSIWASQTGDYYNFDLGTALASEAIQFETATSGEIEWLKGQKNLMMGTDLGEFKISAQGGVITPSDIDIRQQSAYGSAGLLQGQNIGDQILYVSPDRKKVRALTFDTFQQGWFSPDITWIGEHITSVGIKEIHFARDPDNLIFCLLKNGTVATCTYDRSQKSLGWTLYNFGDAPIISMAVINGELGSAVVGALKQTNGITTLIAGVETFGTRTELDSSLVRPVEVGNIVTGLDHLEGLSVSVHVDDALHPDKVVTAGKITLDYAGTTAAVGINFPKRLKTLPLDVGSTQGSGSGNLKHWAKIYIRLVDSSIPLINGIRPATRRPSTPMNQAEPDTTEDVQVTDLGRTRNAQITIEQDLPLKLEVLNLFGIVGQDLL
jgi:hypothetical protein